MTKKIVMALLALTIFIFIIYRHPPVASIADIEATLSAQNLSEDTVAGQLNALTQWVEHFQLADHDIQDAENALPDRTFRSEQDTRLMQQIAALHVQKSTEQDSLFFFRNRIPLYRLFFNILNHHVYRNFLEANEGSENEGEWRIAGWIAQQFERFTNFRLFQKEMAFYQNLKVNHLKSKLLIEFYYRKVYNLLVENPKMAMAYIGTSLKLAKSIGDERRYLEFLGQLQFVLYESFGSTNAAWTLGNHLLQKTEVMGHTMNQALAHYYNGNILIDKGLFPEALTQFESALAIYSKFGHASMVTTLNERMGVVNRHLGRFDAALKFYDKMYEINKILNVPTARSHYLTGRGLVYKEMGKYGSAADFFTESLRFAQQSQDTLNEAVSYLNLGELYFDLGDYDRSLEFHERGLERLLAKENPHLITHAWSQIAEIHLQNHEIEKARAAIANTLARLAKSDFGLLKAKTYLNTGQLQLQIDDFQQALKSFNSGLEIFVQFEFVKGQIEALNLIAETHRRANKPELALQSLNTARSRYDRFPQPAYQWEWHFIAGKIQKDLNHTAESEKELLKSIQLLDDLTLELNSHQQRLTFSQKIQPVFEDMILLKVAQKDAEDAFYFTEKKRAQVFKLTLQNTQEKKSNARTVAPSLAQQSSFPTTEASSQFIDDLRSKLNARACVIVYEITEKDLVIWVISRQIFKAVKVPITRKKLENWLTEFRACTFPENLSTPAQMEETYYRSRALGKRFYENLIAPIAEEISNAELIYIVADEALNYLPFAAIVTPNEDYLIKQHAFALIQSAEILSRRLFKFTPEKVPSMSFPRLLAISADEKLKYAYDEVKKVTDMQAGAELLIGSAVTEKSVRKKLAEDFGIFLFSSHSQIDEKAPYFSSLIVNKEAGQASDEKNDGLLMIHEIQNLNLQKMRLVFLSSCESASGKLYFGEGIVSMQRAFMMAGAQTVIANLWQIADKSAKNLTVDFYKMWFSGKYTKAEALRQAQLHTIAWLRTYPLANKLPHPYYWAPVTLAGAFN
ncbi:MAG: CHAT domain-containing protein [bacterium]